MVLDSGVKFGRFATLMHVHRNTVSNWFETATHSETTLRSAAKALNVSIGSYFPELAQPIAQSHSGPAHLAQDQIMQYGFGISPELQKCNEEVEKWKGKYYDHLEKYNTLLIEYNSLLVKQLQGAS